MMRLSLWQQFCSNHSGFFWVVGTFQSAEAAHSAYDELRQMLFEIDQWHRDHLDESEAAMQSRRLEALPPERAFAQKYNVEWKYTIDWIGWGIYWQLAYPQNKFLNPQGAAEELIDHTISVVSNVVTVTKFEDTWMGVEPFQSILSRLGASVFGYEMDGDTTSVEGIHRYLSFDAPDVVTAESLEKEFKTYLAGSLASEQNLPPWHDDAENFKHVFEGKSLLVGDAVRCYQDRWTEGYRLAERVTKSSDRIHRLYEKSLKRLAVSRHQGFQRAGLHFTFRDLIFENEELGLSAMIAYLEVRGCTNIDFRYSKDNPSTNHD